MPLSSIACPLLLYIFPICLTPFLSGKFSAHKSYKDNKSFKYLDLFSSEMKVNSQYMHVLWFNVKVKEPTTLNEVKEKFFNNKFISMTNKDLTSSVFAFGRDHGHYGRIMNQSVVVEQTLNVRNDHEVTGFCFTPQDGNSILSSIFGYNLEPNSFSPQKSAMLLTYFFCVFVPPLVVMCIMISAMQLIC